MKKSKIYPLFEIPRQSKIRVILNNEKGKKWDDDIIYDHPDGMYSYCLTSDKKIVHLSMSTPLIKISEGLYKIYEDK